MTGFDTSFVNDPVIKWGKYAGSKLSTLPNDYLIWLLEKAESDSLQPKWLNQFVKAEWKRRQESPTTS